MALYLLVVILKDVICVQNNLTLPSATITLDASVLSVMTPSVFYVPDYSIKPVLMIAFNDYGIYYLDGTVSLHP